MRKHFNKAGETKGKKFDFGRKLNRRPNSPLKEINRRVRKNKTKDTVNPTLSEDNISCRHKAVPLSRQAAPVPPALFGGTLRTCVLLVTRGRPKKHLNHPP